MLLNGEEGLECEVLVDVMRLEDVSMFKNLIRVLDESNIDDAECSRKVSSGKTIAGSWRAYVSSLNS